MINCQYYWTNEPRYNFPFLTAWHNTSCLAVCTGYHEDIFWDPVILKAFSRYILETCTIFSFLVLLL